MRRSLLATLICSTFLGSALAEPRQSRPDKAGKAASSGTKPSGTLDDAAFRPALKRADPALKRCIAATCGRRCPLPRS